MSKKSTKPTKSTKWSMWKIILALVACAVSSVGLFIASRVVEPQIQSDVPIDPSTQSIITASSLLLMFSTMAGILTVLCAIWIGFRVRDARIPLWEKNKKRTRGRKR